MVLDDPQRIAAEHDRRAAAAQAGKAREDLDALDRQIGRLRRGIARLIDGYAEEIIDADEFKPRLAGIKLRLARLEAERDCVIEEHEAERSLQLVIGRLSEFAGRVRAGMDQLNWQGDARLSVPLCVESKSTVIKSRWCSVFQGHRLPQTAVRVWVLMAEPPDYHQLFGNIVGGAIIRLIGAVPLEANDEWQARNHYTQIKGMADLAPLPINAKPTRISTAAA